MHRIWSHAALAAAAFVLVPTAVVTIGWFVAPGFRDVDMTGVHELIFLFLLVLPMPAVALSFGVLAPSAIAIDRMTDGRTSRAANLLLGSTLGVPALLAFLVVRSFLASGPHPRAFTHDLTRALSTVMANPGRSLGALAICAMAGIIVGFGMRYRRAA